MDKIKWKKFKRETKLQILNDSDFLNFDSHTHLSVHTINFLNNKLEEILLKNTKNTTKRVLLPKNKVLAERYLKKRNRVDRLLNKNNKHNIHNGPIGLM